MVAKITNFFKPFIVPKARVPSDEGEEDDIVVASTSARPQRQRGDAKVVVRRISASPAAKRKSPPRRRRLSRESSLSSALSMTTPVKRTPKKRSLNSSLDGAADNDDSLYHSSPTPSTQRVMEAVEVPSPRRLASPLPPPPPPPPRIDQPATGPTTSFSSISTLSSMPKSSQSSSRRVIKHGLQAVTNSDSGSDSDDELPDLDTVIPRKKMRMTPPPVHACAHAPDVQKTVKPARQSKRISDQSSKSTRDSTPRLPPSPPRTEYKYSLANMAKAQRMAEQQDARMAQAADIVAQAEKLRDELAAQAEKEVDNKTLAKAMAEDSEDEETLLRAIDQTDALQTEERFWLFQDRPPKSPNVPFPASTLPDKSWANILKDEQARTQACLTGFTADLAAKQMLPAPVVLWFIYQLGHTQRQDIGEAYVEIVRGAANKKIAGEGNCESLLRSMYYTTASKDGEMRSLWGVDTLPPAEQQLFAHQPIQATDDDGDVIKCACGYAKDDGSTVACDACNTWQHINCYYPQYNLRTLPEAIEHRCVDCEPKNIDVPAARKRLRARQAQLAPGKDGSPSYADVAPGLRLVVQAVQYTATWAGVDGIGRALADLALVIIDERTKGDVELRTMVHNAIESLLDDLVTADLDAVYDYMRKKLLDTSKLSKTLQCRLITSLPATSVNTHLLRRRLALYCITISNSSKPPAAASWLPIVLEILKKEPEYRITERTNYKLLLSLSSVLEIAIDAGFSDFAFVHSQQQTLTKSELTGPFATGFASKSSKGEDKFNGQIDVLVHELRKIQIRIKDSGVAHLRRTEAKSALERLIVRLEHSVRTRPKPKQGAFGNGGLGAQQGFMMQRFSTGTTATSPRETLPPETPMPLPERPGTNLGGSGEEMVQMNGGADERDERYDDELVPAER